VTRRNVCPLHNAFDFLLTWNLRYVEGSDSSNRCMDEFLLVRRCNTHTRDLLCDTYVIYRISSRYEYSNANVIVLRFVICVACNILHL